MRSKKNIVSLTFIFFLLFTEIQAIFAGRQDAFAVKAIQMFNAGNYAEAERAFWVLLESDPGNPMLNYYYSASRTENGHFGGRELEYLMIAGKKITPDRLYYYLGIQYHARSNWEQALRYYNQFRISVPEKEQQQLELTQKIQQCFDQVNPFIPVIPLTSTATDNEETDSLFIMAEIPKVISPVDFTFDRQALPDLPGVKSTYQLPSGEPIEFRVNNNITYLFDSQFQTVEGEELFKKGQTLWRELKIDLKKANQLRSEYRNASDPNERAALGEKILAHETESYNLKEQMNSLFSESGKYENEFWANAGSIAVNNFLIELDKIKAVLNEENKTTAPSHSSEEGSPAFSFPGILPELQDTPVAGIAGIKPGQLVYKVQIGAFSRGIPAYRQRLFNKLSLLRKIDNYTDENGVEIYTVGNLATLEDAVKMQSQVKQEGIEDAIIVSYFNGKRITLEQSKKIEAGDDFERD